MAVVKSTLAELEALMKTQQKINNNQSASAADAPPALPTDIVASFDSVREVFEVLVEDVLGKSAGAAFTKASARKARRHRSSFHTA